MKPFAAPGFRVWNLPLPTKVLYTAFCVLTLFGILSSALYYTALVGGGLGGVRAYYAGAAPAGAPDSVDRDQGRGPEQGQGPAMDLPPDEGTRPLIVAITYRKLLEVTHFHLFTMPVVLLIVGHLFFATGIGERAKLGWVGAAAFGVAMHIATPWVVRYGGAAWAPLHTLSGAFMGTCMTVVTGFPALVMWRRPERPGRPERPA